MHDLQAGSAARILVVEDESGILAALTLLLDMEGYRVTEATNGRQALERLRTTVPDLVITDYMMPYMDGIELMRQIRQDPALAGLPVILLSAALPEDIDLTGLADATLSKPVGIDELLDAIARLLPSDH
ncbi:MAG TPA: response regulator [Gammaproteobacteria bacterium]|nr:response regulator [Gammaproteobacteria bacterium]